MTGAGLILGSPAYIAPEIAQGRPVGPASDAWSLGALLFYCVQGRPPFDQRTAIATLTSVVKDPVPAHPQSGALSEVITGLLAKTPAQRMPIDRALTIMKQIADPSPPSTRPAEAIPSHHAGVAPAPSRGLDRPTPVVPHRPAPVPPKRSGQQSATRTSHTGRGARIRHPHGAPSGDGFGPGGRDHAP